jgi:hypothetical protein
MSTDTLPRDVFINCPFDDEYRPMFHGMVFTIIRAGFRPRCSKEVDDGAANRLGTIQDIIEECRYGVHDISRTESDGDPPLPRFNMPFELGMFLGARRYGGSPQSLKRCIIFDRELHRFRRFISDLSGQDPHAHDDDVGTAIEELAAWLRNQSRSRTVPGGRAIAREYRAFAAELPTLAESIDLEFDELTYSDFTVFATEYIALRL